MGNWAINIRGVGSHHNGLADDVDQIFKRVVQELRDAGHSIDDEAFTHGGANTADNVIDLKE